MNNISLTQISLFVAAVCLVSFFVNADEVLAPYNMEETTEVVTNITTNNTNVELTEEIQQVEETSDRFTFTSLDSDQNGKLSQQEVIAGKNNWLMKAFNEIDANTDAAITEQELVNFATYLASNVTK
ncbi:hypothetical protein [Colwellia echini]|uniref:EF-hand domain-containing protein n=1 Tax=Colwellia echini TaxID=1982103 RepID=A0ABY3N236_9GAMM|nr:hypothetical protein [Colwellia echini]TYK67374.1 hypothetical protein CWS31_002290 [Colwellia echini]